MCVCVGGRGGPIGRSYMTVTNRKVVKVLGSRGTCRGMVYAVCVWEGGEGPIGSSYMTVTNRKVVKVLGSRGKSKVQPLSSLRNYE